MARIVTVAAAQLGPNQKSDTREVIVGRIVRLMEGAHKRGAEVIVFPELALTTFFPRWYYEDVEEAESWFETQLPSAATQPIFDAARRYGLTVHLGFAELAEEPDESGTVRKRRFNTAVLISPDGDTILKYRKVHLPGHAELIPERPMQHLEKRYFEVGNLGFPVVNAPLGNSERANVGLLICNDRRWPEAWRELGLQEVEIVMVGYNTPTDFLDPRTSQSPHLRVLHSNLSVQAGAYQNSCFAVAVAKAGNEDGFNLFGSSVIVNPLGEIIAQTSTWEDELIVADCNLELCKLSRATTFDFEKHRRIEAYQRITTQTGSSKPPVWQAGEKA